MKRLIVKGIACLIVLTLCCAAPAFARLISYEGCDYPAGPDIGGLSGGSGWNGAWTKTSTGTFAIVSPGLAYNDGVQNLATRGLAFSGSTFLGDECRRAVQTVGFEYLLTNGNSLGLAGTTNWLSFLCMLQGASFGPTGWFGVNLRRPSVQFFERTVLGHRPSATSQGMFMTNSWVAGGFGAPYTNAGPVVNDQTVFFVTRIIYGSPSTNLRTITLWINPSLTSTPPDSAGTTVDNWPMTYNFGGTTYGYEWDTVALMANAGVMNGRTIFTVDELRIGETYRDVAPRDFEVSPVNKPSNVSPSDGAVDVTLPVTLQASAFSSGAVGDMHQASTFTLRSGNGIITMIETGGLATVQVPAGVLKPATHYTWSVQYKGTNSPAWSDPSEETTFITAADGQPLLVAYDGSAYAPTPWPVDAHDNNGGSGWVSSWQGGYTAAGFMRVAVDSPGLMYKFPGADEYLAVTNNRFRTDERGKEWAGGSEERILGLSRINRQVGTDGGINLVSPSNMYGKAGTTNWFSFLARYEEGDQGARFGIDLYDQSVAIAGDAPFYLMIGKPGAVETWGMAAAGGAFVTSGVSAIDGATAFLVARVIYGDPTETAHLWVNPSTRTQPMDASALVLSGVPNFEFNYIGVHAASSSTAPRCGIDELRFGTTWEAVMPLGAPPPPIVGTPTNIAPADASVEVSVTPVIQASVFNGAGAGDTHVATEAKFLSGDGIESLIVTSGLVTFQVPAGALRHSTRYTWSVRYRGSNVPDWSEWSEATAFSTLQGPLQLLAYDGAAYGRATNGIQNFNGGTGWAGVWEGMWWNFDAITYCQTRVNVEAPGLAYTDAGLNSLVNTSNTFITSDFGSYLGTDFDIPGTRSRRTLGHDGALHLLNVSNMFGRVGTTNWFSFLARYESGEPNSYFGIELAGDGTAEKQSSRFVIGKPATASEWGLQAASGASAASTVNALSNSAFLVARLVFGATVSADLWVDPLFEADPPATPSASLTDVAPFEWSRVGIVSHGGAKCALVSIDEVRVGESWQSVTPFVPEPAMLAVCGAALAIAFRRARR